MILGRNVGLWAAVVAALLNVAVGVFGIGLTVDQVIELNVAALAIIAIVANESAPGTVSTFAASTTPPVNPQ